MKGFITILLTSLGYFSYSQVTVSHFNSNWNEDNNYDISALKECDKDYIVICHNQHLQEKHKIKSVPTVIVFEDDEEIKRYEANIMMQLTCSIKDIQHVIDSVYLKRFE